jgi:hypothetical protein
VSVTTVLVPLLEVEVHALLLGRAPEEMIDRANRVRRRVQAVDASREELHVLLYPLWERGLAARRPSGPRGPISLLTRLVTPRRPPPAPPAYDPYVQVFGRSLPVAGDTPRAVADRLTELMGKDDPTFEQSFTEDLRRLDARATDVVARHRPGAVGGVALAVAAEVGLLRQCLDADPPRLSDAWTAIVSLQAWSWPVWRLDGDMIGQLLEALGIAIRPEPPRSVFEPWLQSRGLPDTALAGLPGKLPSFRAAGGYFPAAQVKALAGSIGVQSSRLAQNALRNADDPDAALRNLRLLSEAAFYCERNGLGLAEAAGLEWHDRQRNS